jgi:hypothetical protein
LRVWESVERAAVSSVLELEGPEAEFTNTSFFSTGGPRGWRCLWWQVTAAEAKLSEHGS